MAARGLQHHAVPVISDSGSRALLRGLSRVRGFNYVHSVSPTPPRNDTFYNCRTIDWAICDTFAENTIFELPE